MKPYNTLTYDEKLACISLYPEESKKDMDNYIRQEAYRSFGYTEEAKEDSDWEIRQEAYRSLSYTEESKKDSHWAIRLEAELYFKVKDNK